MNPPPMFDRSPVTLSRVFTPTSVPRVPAASREAAREAARDAAAAAVLAAQAGSRIGAALCVAVIQLAIVHWVGGGAAPAVLLGIALAYAAFAVGSAVVIERLRRVTPVLVTVVLAGDLAFVFAM